MHLDVSQGRYCVELIIVLKVDQVLDAVSIVTNTEAHSSERHLKYTGSDFMQNKIPNT